MSCNLSIASFNNKGLKLDTAESVEQLFNGYDLACVRELVMSGNTIGVEAGRALANLIWQMPNLQVVDLSNIFITRSIEEIPHALAPIRIALAECSQLTEVDIGDNAFGQRAVDSVLPLFTDGPPLEVLKIANIGMNTDGGRTLASAIAKAAKEKQEAGVSLKLKTLVLSRNLLGDGSAEAWGNVISSHPTLERFESNRNDFREFGIVAISKALIKCPNLRHLIIEDAIVSNMDNDTIEGLVRCWRVISDVVRRSALQLETLHLPSCSFQGDGCGELMDALNQHVYPKLKSIRLEHNDFEDRHFRSLLSAVKKKLPVLTFLKVTINDNLKDNKYLKEIGHLLMSRQGKLVVLHEDDFSDDDEENIDSEEEREGLEQEESVVGDLKSGTTDGVDQLADLVREKLAVD